MKPWEKDPIVAPARRAARPWEADPVVKPAEVAPPAGGAVSLAPLAPAETPAPAAPARQPGGAESFGAGAIRGLRDLVDSGAYLVPKALSFATSAYGLAPNPVSQWFESEASRVSDINKQAEADFQSGWGDSGWATAGRVAGNVGTAFIPGTGQANLANKASNLWKAGGFLPKLGAVGVGAGLGAGQGVMLGTKTDDDSVILNAALGGAGGAIGQGVAGGVADGVNAVRRTVAGAPYRQGERLLRAAVDPDAVITRLAADGQELVPGSVPMAHQVADDAGISRLVKAVRNYSARIPTREAQQDAARRAAVTGIATPAGSPIEAAENVGELIAQRATENRRLMAEAVSGAYKQPAVQGTYLTPPSAEIRQVLRQFYPGRIPSGTPEEGAVRALVENLSDGVPIPFAEFQKFRKLAGQKAYALANSDPTAASAYGKIRDILDSLPDRAVEAGNLDDAAATAIREARGLRRVMGERFDTGPATGIFRRGSDGLPQRQGAEVTRSFFSSKPSQRADIDALGQLLPGDDEVLAGMRRYAITDLDSTATKGSSGEYSASKFSTWLADRAEALPGVLTPDQRTTLRNVGQDLSRAERAVALGAARGGSDTEMNQILSAGVLDSPILTGFIDQVVRRVPFVGNATANVARGVQGGLAESARKRAAEELAQLIMDPRRAADVMRAAQGVQTQMIAPSARLPLTLTPALAGVLAGQ